MKMTKPSPEFFYHYTSIENLALILQNRKIRFTRADLVNDLEEINIVDKPEVRKSAFLSCWTDVEVESIPMWNLYANKSKGVRVRLKFPIFEDSTSSDEVPNHNCKIMVIKNIKNFISREKDYEWVKYLFGPIKVSYTNTTQVNILGKDNSLCVEKIGTIKPEHWSFENEYRFLALANHEWNNETKNFEIKSEPYHSKVIAEYFDMKIDNNIFNQIGIQLGPSCKEPERIIVESLLEKYTENGTVTDSKLKGIIRI